MRSPLCQLTISGGDCGKPSGQLHLVGFFIDERNLHVDIRMRLLEGIERLLPDRALACALERDVHSQRAGLRNAGCSERAGHDRDGQRCAGQSVANQSFHACLLIDECCCVSLCFVNRDALRFYFLLPGYEMPAAVDSVRRRVVVEDVGQRTAPADADAFRQAAQLPAPPPLPNRRKIAWVRASSKRLAR